MHYGGSLPLALEAVPHPRESLSKKHPKRLSHPKWGCLFLFVVLLINCFHCFHCFHISLNAPKTRIPNEVTVDVNSDSLDLSFKGLVYSIIMFLTQIWSLLHLFWLWFQVHTLYFFLSSEFSLYFHSLGSDVSDHFFWSEYRVNRTRHRL